MKLYRYTQRAITPHGQLVEPGEEVLLNDDVIPSAHMIDVRAESEARLAGLNYEDVHTALHTMPDESPPHLNLTPVRNGPVLAWVGPGEAAPVPVVEEVPAAEPVAEPVAVDPVPEG